MYKKILISLFVGLFGLFNTGLAYAGFLDNAGSIGNSFSASTLSLNLTNSDNSPIFYPLFFSSDLTPGASKSASFKINKDGAQDFKYNIYFVKTFGDDNLCNALNIEAKLEGTTMYDGSLSGLSIFPSTTITGGEDEWMLKISLPGSSAELREKKCFFDLIVKGWQTDSDGSWGFSDSDSIGSELSTTTWTVPDASSGARSEGSQLNSLNSKVSDPSAELNPNTPDESSPAEETVDPELTPTPTPSPTPEEASETVETPTPTPTSVPEEVVTQDSPTE